MPVYFYFFFFLPPPASAWPAGSCALSSSSAATAPSIASLLLPPSSLRKRTRSPCARTWASSASNASPDKTSGCGDVAFSAAAAAGCCSSCSPSGGSYRGTIIEGLASGTPPAMRDVSRFPKLRASAGTPSWSSNAAAIEGVTGCEHTPTYRSVSISTQRTVPMRTVSVLRRAQGACVSMYRLACCTSALVAWVTRCSCSSSVRVRSRGSSARAAASISSSASVSVSGIGVAPSQCLCAKERVRYARFPRSLDSLALIQSVIFACEKSPSEPNGTSLMRK
mmetsp:Transcript_36614/g.72964  ORF Transcript_36614/g.72964 Transcript_36614/m.72964 type:complete len:280 (+) Transcript_36614:199-1038(+)